MFAYIYIFNVRLHVSDTSVTAQFCDDGIKAAADVIIPLRACDCVPCVCLDD